MAAERAKRQSPALRDRSRVPCCLAHPSNPKLVTQSQGRPQRAPLQTTPLATARWHASAAAAAPCCDARGSQAEPQLLVLLCCPCTQRRTRRNPHASVHRLAISFKTRQASGADGGGHSAKLSDTSDGGLARFLNPVVAACEKGARRGASCAQQRARSANPRRNVEHTVSPPPKPPHEQRMLAPRSAAQTEGAAHQASSRQHQAPVTARVGRCSAGAPRCAAETRQHASARPSVTTAARRAPPAARAAPGQGVAPSGRACGERGAATRLQRAGRRNRPTQGLQEDPPAS